MTLDVRVTTERDEPQPEVDERVAQLEAAYLLDPDQGRALFKSWMDRAEAVDARRDLEAVYKRMVQRLNRADYVNHELHQITHNFIGHANTGKLREQLVHAVKTRLEHMKSTESTIEGYVVDTVNMPTKSEIRVRVRTTPAPDQLVFVMEWGQPQ